MLYTAIDELFAQLDIGPQTACTLLRALLTTAYSDILAPVLKFCGDALEVLGFRASDPNYALASDDEEIVVVDLTTSPNASSATLRPASSADSLNSICSIATDSVPATAPVVSLIIAPAALLAPEDLSVPTATHAAAKPTASVPFSAIPAAANNAAAIASATDTASPATPMLKTPLPLELSPPRPPCSICQTILCPPMHPKTPFFHHLLWSPPSTVIMSQAQTNQGHSTWPVVAETSEYLAVGKLLCTTRWQLNDSLIIWREILSPFVMGVSHSAYSRVSGIQEGHTRMAAAINAGFASYLT